MIRQFFFKPWEIIAHGDVNDVSELYNKMSKLDRGNKQLVDKKVTDFNTLSVKTACKRSQNRCFRRNWRRT